MHVNKNMSVFMHSTCSASLMASMKPWPRSGHAKLSASPHRHAGNHLRSRFLLRKCNGSRTCLVQTFGRAGNNLGRDGLRNGFLFFKLSAVAKMVRACA